MNTPEAMLPSAIRYFAAQACFPLSTDVPVRRSAPVRNAHLAPEAPYVRADFIRRIAVVSSSLECVSYELFYVLAP